MTICIAAIHRYIYSAPDVDPPDVGHGVIVASDRMWTNIGIGAQYEPGGQGKFALVTPTAIILIADDVDVHSEVLQILRPFFTTTPVPDTYAVAQQYAEVLNGVKSERAAKFAFGSTYGFTAARFAELQGKMDSAVVARLDQEMERYEQHIGAEAIVAGCDSDNRCHIYHVDRHGIVHCYDDVGFFCIGAGRNQSNAEFIQRSYSNMSFFYQTLALVYVAKKAAQTTAPGVGPSTDMLQIVRGSAAPISASTLNNLETMYQSYDKKRKTLEETAIRKLMAAEEKMLRDIISSQPRSAADPNLPAQQTPQVSSKAPRAGKRAGILPRSRQRRSVRRNQ